MTEWYDDIGCGIVQGEGCYRSSAEHDFSFSMRQYLKSFGHTDRINERTKGLHHIISNYPECFSSEKLKRLYDAGQTDRVVPTFNMAGQLIV